MRYHSVAKVAAALALIFGSTACDKIQHSQQPESYVRVVKLKAEVFLSGEACGYAQPENGETEEVRVAVNLKNGTLAVMAAKPQFEAPGNWQTGCRVIDKDHWDCTKDGFGYSTWAGRLRERQACYTRAEVE